MAHAILTVTGYVRWESRTWRRVMVFCSRGIFQLFTPRYFLVLSLLLWGTSVFSQSPATPATDCGPLRGGSGQFGPFDYRTDRDKLPIVEGAHFEPWTEGLIRGRREKLAAPDIDYTLRAFPNHHRALIAMMRLGERENKAQPVGSRYTVECWFDRAVRFRPDDSTVRMIYATYLSKNKRQPEAIFQLEQATGLAKDNAFTHYNIGLVYFDMKAHDKALARAHRALELGFENTELRDLLKSAGQWQEPSVDAKPLQ